MIDETKAQTKRIWMPSQNIYLARGYGRHSSLRQRQTSKVTRHVRNANPNDVVELCYIIGFGAI
jgi:hypothetical protein